jgi:transposase
MLMVEERFMIQELHRKGVSISEIARQTGHDRKTIRRVLAEPLIPARPPRQPRARKIDPYLPYLEQRVADGVLNARKLYQEIQAQGYPGKETQVRAVVTRFRHARPAAVTVRFETEPGEQAQVDWGHFGQIEHHGRLRRLYAFVMTLGWSRTIYLEFTISLELVWFLRCHLHAFRAFGGVPRQVLHDNLKTAVLERRGGAIHWQPQYLDFAHYYGFTPRACQPYRAQTKGKVERSIQYVRGNFWVGLHFTDLADLNQQARVWCETVANRRVHATTGEVPRERLGREGLLPLGGKPDYDTSLVSFRYSSRDCLISYGGNYYSVPASAARQRLLVRATATDELIISSPEGAELARHRLASGLGQRVLEPRHYQDVVPTSPARAARAARAGARQVARALLVDLPDAPTVEVRPLADYDRIAEVTP